MTRTSTPINAAPLMLRIRKRVALKRKQATVQEEDPLRQCLLCNEEVPQSKAYVHTKFCVENYEQDHEEEKFNVESCMTDSECEGTPVEPEIKRHKKNPTDHLRQKVRFAYQESAIQPTEDTNTTALISASQAGNTQTVLDIINNLNTPIDINEQDSEGATALHYAALNGHLEIVKHLIEHNAKVNIKTQEGRTPLHCATFGSHVNIVTYLLNRQADIKETDSRGRTAMHIAAEKGLLGVVQALAHCNENVCSMVDEFLHTPLHLSVQENRLEVSRYLIDLGCDVNAKNSDGHSPLHIAVFSGHTELVLQLLLSGADASIEDKDGKSALHFAAFKGHMEPCILLLRHGVNVDSKTIAGMTALHIACYKNYFEIASTLLKHGANVNVVQSQSGYNALHFAAHAGHSGLIKLLLENGANKSINERTDGNGYTALHFCASRGRIEDVSALLDAGANTEVADNKKRTPLFLAAEQNRNLVVDLLLEHGADPEVRNASNDTILNATLSNCSNPNCSTCDTMRSIVSHNKHRNNSGCTIC